MFNTGSELGFFLVKRFPFSDVTYFVHFLSDAASIVFLSIFGQKIGVLKSPALFQGKELKVTIYMLQGHVLLVRMTGPLVLTI